MNLIGILAKRPIHWATHKKNVRILKMLIENGADVNAVDSLGFSSLHWAVYDPMDLKKNESEEIVKILIENGANIKKKTNSGDTPRDLAEQKGNSVTNQFTKIIQIIEIYCIFQYVDHQNMIAILDSELEKMNVTVTVTPKRP